MRYILALLLAAGVCSPQSIIVVKKKAAAPSYLIRETFDGSTLCYSGFGSTCDNAWFYGSSPTVFNYATSPAPLQGSRSLRTGGAGQAQINFAAQDEVYVAAMINVDAFTGAGLNLFDIRNSANANLCQAGAWTTTQILAYSSGGSNATYNVALSAGTTYYIKIRAKKGTGNNAECQVYFSTNGTTWNGATSTNGTWTTQPSRFSAAYNSNYVITDDIRVSTSDINY